MLSTTSAFWSKPAGLVGIAAAMFLASAVVAAAGEAATRTALPDDDAALVRAARMRECEALELAFAAVSTAYDMGTVTLDVVIESRKRLLDAKLELAKTSAERIDICRVMAENALNLERRAHILYTNGAKGGGAETMWQTMAARLECETRLIQELIKAKRPGDGPVVLTPHYNPKDRNTIAEIERLGGHVTVDEKRSDLPVVAVSFSIHAQMTLPHRLGEVGARRQPLASRPSTMPAPAPAFLPEPNAASPVPLQRPQRPYMLLPHPGSLQDRVREDLSESVVRHIGQLKELRRLDLSGVAVTDAALKHLAPLVKLETLNLPRSKVTMAGINTICPKPLRSLKTLDLRCTKISEAETRALKQELPELEVLTSPPELPPSPLRPPHPAEQPAPLPVPQ
jgi:hypothetical protein